MFRNYFICLYVPLHDSNFFHVPTRNKQLIKEKQIDLTSTPIVRVGSSEEVSDEKVEMVLRKAVCFTSSIQAHDGHWPSEDAGPLFFTPLLVRRYVPSLISLLFSLIKIEKFTSLIAVKILMYM